MDTLTKGIIEGDEFSSNLIFINSENNEFTDSSNRTYTWTGSSGSEYFDLTKYEGDDGTFKNFGFSDAYGFAKSQSNGADIIVMSSTDSSELSKFKLSGNNVIYDNRITLASSQTLSDDTYLLAGTDSNSPLLYKATSNGLVYIDNVNPINTNDANNVIKAFMASLDKTSLRGEDALDEAVQACSDFTSWDDLVNNFISDCRSYNGDAGKFLEEKCSIRLYNEDTGAISGYDAGSGVVKTAESVVSETTSSFTYPSSTSSVFSGLTVTWPRSSTLSSTQRTIVAGLNTWWIPQALKIIQDSYGLSFTGNNATVKTMNVKFVNENSNTLAYVNSTYTSSGGAYKTTKLTLNINMKYFSDISSTDLNGDASTTYLDRTIAHEMTHAVMAATIDDFNYLPNVVTEGVAELTHGIDDERRSVIADLAKDSSTLASVIAKDSSGDTNIYAAGYMLLRYLAYQASDASESSESTLPSGTDVLTADGDNTLLTSTGSKPLTLIAKGTGDTLDGGTNNTDDTLWSAGAGKNTTFVLHINGGVDIVKNFVFGGNRYTDDVLALDISFSNIGLIIPYSGTVRIGFDGLGSITLTGEIGQNKFAYNYGGNLGIVSADMSSSGMVMSFDSEANYYVGQGNNTSLVFTKDDYIAGTGSNGSFSGFGWNSPYISEGLGIIDGREGDIAAINGDNTVSQIIYASTVVGGDTSKAGDSVYLCGGIGENFSNTTDDTLVGSANGNTTFYVGHKMGDDVLSNAVGDDTVVFIDTKYADLASCTGTANTFNATFNNGTEVKLTAAENITSSNSITVQFDDVTYKWNGSYLTQ